MNKKIELLAPGGDIDSIKAAIVAGADAVYCGLNRFNARNRAKNITIDELNGVVKLAHNNGCEIFLTLNTIIVESEIPAIIGLLNKLINSRIDGIIVQDIGLFYLLNENYKELKIHASTQLTTHNRGQIQFLKALSATRVNLSRELNVGEISELATIAHENSLLIEVFVHGSQCISFSGLCYLSSVHGGNSGNRGRCSQPCRDQYVTPSGGAKHPFNLKDNSAFSFLGQLAEAGVDSIKIEGRIKKFHYVYTVVDAWRKQLTTFQENGRIGSDNGSLFKVFNRGFSTCYLEGDINKSMFIDNPRDNSALHLSTQYGSSSKQNLQRAKQELYDEKTDIINNVQEKISRLSIEKAPIDITITGAAGTPLIASVVTPDCSFKLQSTEYLTKISADNSRHSTPHLKQDSGDPQPGKYSTRNNRDSLEHEISYRCMQIVKASEYYINNLRIELSQDDLSLPFHELNSLKKDIRFRLNGSKRLLSPQSAPKLEKQSDESITTKLSVLLSSQEDVDICEETEVDLYFQLPDALALSIDEQIKLFQEKANLMPWFPSILIGDDYHAAVHFLKRVRPAYIVTNNTGIACEAKKQEISWIAGPHFNLVNSYSLLSLKENFNCSGAFLSNELSRFQLKCVQPPDEFQLFYSIYHPILLMTSRQCLFHQVVGCEKEMLDLSCLRNCEQNVSIANLKEIPLVIEKSKENYHNVYNGSNFLNTDIISDLPDRFSRFMIDLRRIETKTDLKTTTAEIVSLFNLAIQGNPDSISELHRVISPTVYNQYSNGI